ncbi:hypothetical protein [Hyalangium gracile]|uniref:hypothetical protein n=1 Tax=Hyalangium gracile TaxID=394092 RepID=UPI001CCAD9A7|nr:hypothetical protein [Hyalangium gracile]
MRNTLATVIAVGVLSGTLAVAAAPVTSGKVYSGGEGVSVALVPLTTKGPKGEKQVLVHPQGTETEFDGKAMLAVHNDKGRSADYIIQYKGEDYYVVIMREAYGSKNYELWVPGRRDAIRVSFDEKRTEKLKAEDLYEKYQKQNKDGTLSKMAAFNRQERESEQNQSFAELVKSMNDTCGSKVMGIIDWKSVSDDVIKKYSISSYCGNPLEALRRLCSDSAVSRKVISAKVKSVACQFGPEMQLDIKAGAVSFTTQQDAANQEEYATRFFEKNL